MSKNKKSGIYLLVFALVSTGLTGCGATINNAGGNSSADPDMGSDFSAANICDGKSIFGTVGTAACAAFFDNSYRDKSDSETRLVPVVATDTDGHQDANVDQVDHAALDACGTTQVSVEARIADCATVNADAATWDGAEKSNSGHGVWKLVSKTLDGAPGKEVWRDERTGLLWGDHLGTVDGTTGVPTGGASHNTFGWCFASGNTENAGGIDCQVGVANSNNRAGVSLCAEVDGLLTPDGVHDDIGNDGDDAVDDDATNSNNVVTWGDVGTAVIDAKGGMKLTATSISPSVTWKLPNREDYFLAYANGMSYVLPRFQNNYFWTSSVSSGSPYVAWGFGADGNGFVVVDAYDRADSDGARCVGR